MANPKTFKSDFQRGIEAMRKEVLDFINAAGLTAHEDGRAEAEQELAAMRLAVQSLQPST